MKSKMIMSDFFSFYELEPAFILDEQLLRRKFLELSRAYHPDFYGAESDEKQAEALELSSKNNEVFKVLSDFDRRFSYILNLHGLLDEHKNKNALPQSFLFEMMELNEALSEIGNEYKPHTFTNFAYLAHFFESGTRPHIIKIKRKYTTVRLRHPGMREMPIFQETFNSKANQAATRLITEVGKSIAREFKRQSRNK